MIELRSVSLLGLNTGDSLSKGEQRSTGESKECWVNFSPHSLVLVPTSIYSVDAKIPSHSPRVYSVYLYITPHPISSRVFPGEC